MPRDNLSINAEILRELDRGALAVTANNRLARALVRDFDEAMARSGRAAWPRPQALPWEAWLGGLWDEAWADRVVLAPPQCEALWEAIVGEDAGAGGVALLDVAATARAAAEARRLQSLYRIPRDPEPFPTGEETAFAAWNARFEERLAARGWLDAAALPEAVARAVERGRIPVPPRLLLVGFDELLPAHRRVLGALAAAGCSWRAVAFPQRAGRARLAALADAEAQYRAAAAWACDLLRQNPNARIAIVDVDLEANAALAERLLTEALAPEALLPGAGEVYLPFDLSLGAPLGDEPVASAAFSLLTALSGPLDLWEWRNLLLSPFWGAGEGDRAVFAARLLSEGFTIPTLGLVAGRAPQFGATPPLAELLKRLALAARGLPREAAPSAMSRAFAAALDLAGWGRGAGLSSREYQAAQAFRETLARLAAFDGVAPSVSRSWALSRLRQLLRDPFRPEGDEPPLRVMGALEAAGFAFDHLWALGLSEQSLPKSPRPSPFLPIRRQIAAGVRQATAQGEFSHAVALVERLLASSDDVIVSYPRTVDGNPAGPCRLIAQLPLLEDEPALSPALGSLVGAAPLEVVAEIAKPLEEGEPPRGGVRLLADQAECPFRAFARHRLGLGLWEEPGEGLSAADQGTGVHEALHALHRRFPDRASLADAPPAELEEAIALAARAGVERIAKRRAEPLGESLKRVEESRMRSLLASWVELELARPDFAVVEREAARTLILGGLTLNLRVDRLDRVMCREDGGLLIDYKSGASEKTLNMLEEERIVDPQLPLYALACPEARGVCYAELDRGECSLKGLSEDDHAVKGMKTVDDWDGLVAAWRERLTRVAREFCEGRADADPWKPKACERCEINPLCRFEKQGDEA